MNEKDDHDFESDGDGVSWAMSERPVTEEPSERADEEQNGGFRMPAGFSLSLLPNMDDFWANVVTPVKERMHSLMPNYSAIVLQGLASKEERIREQAASIVASFPTFSMPAFNLPALYAPALNFAPQDMVKTFFEQNANAMAGLRKSLRPLVDPEVFQRFNRVRLPPNLRAHSDEIKASQVRKFVEQEGIPLYLVPRGRTAMRLLKAKDRAGRRRVLGASYESLMEDCSAVLERATHVVVSDERGFALDGLGAMRAGHARSAQAMFTVTLDTLIYRFYPDRKIRGVITNRKRDADIPDEIDEMGLREAFVWLPVWNAHEEFWKHKGDKVPHYYSRHASVHGVSSRQFSKRNCVQVLMLVTSLIGYADQLAREEVGTDSSQ